MKKIIMLLICITLLCSCRAAEKPADSGEAAGTQHSMSPQELLLEQGITFDGYNQSYRSVDSVFIDFVGNKKFEKYAKDKDDFNIVNFVNDFKISKEKFTKLARERNLEHITDEMIDVIYSNDSNRVGIFFNRDSIALAEDDADFEKDIAFYTIKGCLIRHINAENSNAFYKFMDDTSPKAFNISNFMSAYDISESELDEILAEGKCSDFYDDVL